MKSALILLILFSAGFAKAQQICGEINGTPAYKYCITKTPGSSNKDVLFYLHGAGGDEKFGSFVLKSLKNNWNNQNHEAPVLISVSFGPFWLLTKANEAPYSGLLEVFKNSVMPTLEEKALGGPAKKRLLLGHSMGGFNSAQILFHSPPELFAKAAILCPGIVDLSPWATLEQMRTHAQYLGIAVSDLEEIADLVKSFVSDEDFYQSFVNPIKLAETSLAGKTKLFIVVNAGDRRFRDGGEKLYKAAPDKTSIQFQTWSGGHCATDYKKLSEFLK